jgi:hypothetical protein
MHYVIPIVLLDVVIVKRLRKLKPRGLRSSRLKVTLGTLSRRSIISGSKEDKN